MAALRSRPRRSSSSTASRQGTRPNTCRPSCTWAARPPPHGQRAPRPRVPTTGSPAAHRRTRAAWRAAMLAWSWCRYWNRAAPNVRRRSSTSGRGTTGRSMSLHARRRSTLRDAAACRPVGSGQRWGSPLGRAVRRRTTRLTAPRPGRNPARGGPAPAIATPSGGSRGTSGRSPSPRPPTASACRARRVRRAASRTPTAGSW